MAPDQRSALAAELKTATGGPGGGWQVAYQAGQEPKAADFLSFGIAQPFVFADAGHTVVFLLVVHCTTACYGTYQGEIRHVMSSVTISRLGQPTGPFTGVVGR